MRIDKKHFPPISVFDTHKTISLVIPESMQFLVNNISNPEKAMKALILEGKQNIISSTKEAEIVMTKSKRKCVNAYLEDPDRKAFGGAYIDMEMPIPSMDLFKFIPSMNKNEVTGIEKVEITCLFMSVQGNSNTVVSYGAITFRDFKEDSLIIDSSFACVNEEEKNNTINYIRFLLELNCFLEYGKTSEKNIQKVYGNQRKKLPEGYVIDNRSGYLIKCLCVPQK